MMANEELKGMRRNCMVERVSCHFQQDGKSKS